MRISSLIYPVRSVETEHPPERQCEEKIMANTKIEWADKVWNWMTGCSPVSEGCDHCWAKRMANRLKGRYGYLRDDPFKVTIHPERFIEPMSWRKHRYIFVCSMGDMFHDDVPSEIIQIAFDRMAFFDQHTYLLLTKRPHRMLDEILIWKEYCTTLGLPFPTPNVWLGASVENQRTADERIPIFLQIPAVKHFVSVEPMLGFVNIPWPDGWPSKVSYIDWIICGGETGPKARPMHPDWVESLRDQCQTAGVPFFFKQWGEWTVDYEHPSHIIMRDGTHESITQANCCSGVAIRRVGKKKAGNLLDGREWNEFPKEIQR